MHKTTKQRLVFTAGMLGMTAAQAHPGHAGHGEAGLILGGLLLLVATLWISRHRQRNTARGLTPAEPD